MFGRQRHSSGATWYPGINGATWYPGGEKPVSQNGDMPDADRDVEPNVEVLLAKVISLCTSSLAPCSTTTEQTLNEQEMARRVTDST
jgi:hypothetical protein